MAGKPRVKDEDVRTAEALVKMGEEKGQAEIAALKSKLEAAPWVFEMAGKVKTLSFTEAQARFLKIVLLKQVKDSKEYREKYGMTWQAFCEHVGINFRTADEWLSDIAPFNAEFLTSFVNFSGFDFNKIRYLGKAALTSDVKIEGNRLLFDNEAIPFEPEAVTEFCMELQNKLRAEREDKKAALSAKDKVLKAKEELLNKQEKQLARFDKEAKAKGLSAEEDAFMTQMGNLRIQFDGWYMLSLDPGKMQIEEDSTRMKAAYLTTLQYMRAQLNAAYDTAMEIFGNPVMFPEEGWQAGDIKSGLGSGG